MLTQHHTICRDFFIGCINVDYDSFVKCHEYDPPTPPTSPFIADSLGLSESYIDTNIDTDKEESEIRLGVLF